MRLADAQIAFESRELVEKGSHFHVRVNAEIELAAVRGSSRDGDFDPKVAFMRETDVERGWFGDDGPVDFESADQVGGTEAAVLLVRHGRDQDISAQADSA